MQHYQKMCCFKIITGHNQMRYTPDCKARLFIFNEEQSMGEDLRVIKTRESIQAKFWSLLEKYPFDKISVKMLIDECRINRSTFYRNYEDKYDLLNQVADIFLSRFRTTIHTAIISESFYHFDDMVAYLDPVVAFFWENRERLLLIDGDPYVKSVIFGKMFDIMSATFQECIIETFHVSDDQLIDAEYFAQILTHNILETIRWWQLVHPDIETNKIKSIIAKCSTYGVYESLSYLGKQLS